MSPPSVPVSLWIWAAFDPILIVAALWLGSRADQVGKIFIAAIAALGAALLLDALVTAVGLPWIAPLSREGPMLIPVRSIAAVVWAALGYALRPYLTGTRQSGERP